MSGSWLGSGLQNSVKNFAGARTVMKKEDIDNTGAADFGDVMRRIPGMQATDNSGTAGSAVSLNIGVRGLTGRYSPRSTVLLDGIPLAVGALRPAATVVRAGQGEQHRIDRRRARRRRGALRPAERRRHHQLPQPFDSGNGGVSGDASFRYNDFGQGGQNRQYSAFVGTQQESGLGVAVLYSGMPVVSGARAAMRRSTT